MEQFPAMKMERGEQGLGPELQKLYQDAAYVTLYRYENPQTTYNENREGVVSRREFIGGWFTNNLEDLKTYIKARQPGGRIVAVRVPKNRLDEFDATKREDTRDMDIEAGNYVIPPEVSEPSRLEIPFSVEAKLPTKFSFGEWKKINEFVDTELAFDKLLARADNKNNA